MAEPLTMKEGRKPEYSEKTPGDEPANTKKKKFCKFQTAYLCVSYAP